MGRRGSIKMDPQIDRNQKILSERILKPSPSVGQSWIGCTIVLLCAGFFLLTLREGTAAPYQQIVDSIFHNWIAMGSVTIGLWVVRRLWRGTMPRAFQILSGFLLLCFALFTGLNLVAWTPLWQLLKPFRVPQSKAQALAAFALVAMWFFFCVGFLFRTVFRWLRNRYEHHGVAVGFGPMYFYFKRRKAS